MKNIQVDAVLCSGCSLCESACPLGAVVIKKGIPEFTTACSLCGACIDICPAGAIEILYERKESDKALYKDIWVFIERENGSKITNASLEVLSEAAKLSQKTGEKCAAVLFGPGGTGLKDVLASYGTDKLYLVENTELKEYNTEIYARATTELIVRFKPSVVLFSGTTVGKDLAPRVAARLQTGLTADCTKLEIDENGNLVQVRPTYGGDILAHIICPYRRPQMATIRPGVFKKNQIEAKKIEIDNVEICFNSKSNDTELIDEIKELSRFSNLTEADVIVSGGKGLGEAKNFSMLEELAELLGGVVGASRSAVDAGWITHHHQVGQTGKTVSPKLYIACAISGAIQHLMGMQGSQKIIAINKDEGAPIFKVADLGIVGDVFEVIPELIRMIKEKQRVCSK